jgi:predicted enzyme related to lactoylglutathione lyase
MKKVIGVGGVFIKSRDSVALNEWYKKHLGFDITPYGTTFDWADVDGKVKNGLTQWNLFPESTDYFAPSTKEFMINYIVDDLQALFGQLMIEEVNILDSIDDTEYGKFLHILDIEGNKIQLWEPVKVK